MLKLILADVVQEPRIRLGYGGGEARYIIRIISL